jgi:hypothetical protein
MVIWHRFLLAEPADMDDIARAVAKLYEHRLELMEVDAPVRTPGAMYPS